jgi:import inner membrane translocase subunit TIM8
MASDLTIDQSDIEKLNDKDKTELRQFFANEEHRSRIQSRTFVSLFLSTCAVHNPYCN